MLDEYGLGNDGARAAGAGKPSNRDDQVKEKSDEVPHPSILANLKMPGIRPNLTIRQGQVKFHIAGDLGDRKIGRVEREELQSFLDRKADAGLSFSTVDHLRWDLHQIFSLAVDEGHIGRNPARLLKS